ncbi:MAG: helix-turn-helix transcriptional regulator [Myxococcota bacterium]
MFRRRGHDCRRRLHSPASRGPGGRPHRKGVESYAHPGEGRSAALVGYRVKQSGPPFPSLATLCRRVGCSARTLRRRLGEEGTGYQELLDEARFTWAKRALRYSRRPVTEIAYDLGYSAPSNFTRAFRRALGISPSAFRSSEREL